MTGPVRKGCDWSNLKIPHDKGEYAETCVVCRSYQDGCRETLNVCIRECEKVLNSPVRCVEPGEAEVIRDRLSCLQSSRYGKEGN